MFFTQFEFFVFALVLLGVLAAVGSNRVRKAVLIVASLFFYGYWDVRFLALLLAVVGVNYLCGLKVGADTGRRKPWLVAAVIFDVGLLGIFKYYNFSSPRSTRFSAFGSAVCIGSCRSGSVFSRFRTSVMSRTCIGGNARPAGVCRTSRFSFSIFPS